MFLQHGSLFACNLCFHFPKSNQTIHIYGMAIRDLATLLPVESTNFQRRFKGLESSTQRFSLVDETIVITKWSLWFSMFLRLFLKKNFAQFDQYWLVGLQTNGLPLWGFQQVNQDGRKSRGFGHASQLGGFCFGWALTAAEAWICCIGECWSLMVNHNQITIWIYLRIFGEHVCFNHVLSKSRTKTIFYYFSRNIWFHKHILLGIGSIRVKVHFGRCKWFIQGMLWTIAMI